MTAPRLGRIERYVLVHVLAGIGAATALLGAVVLLIDFIDLSRSLGGRAEISIATELGLTLLKSPSVLLQLAPFVFLFGVLGAFMDMNRRNELIAIRAAGVSAWRFILPAAAAAFVLGVAAMVLLNPIAAGMNGLFESARASLTPQETSRTRHIWLRQGDLRTQMVIGAASRASLSRQ